MKNHLFIPTKALVLNLDKHVKLSIGILGNLSLTDDTLNEIILNFFNIRFFLLLWYLKYFSQLKNQVTKVEINLF